MITKEKILELLSKPNFWTIKANVDDCYSTDAGGAYFDLEDAELFAYNQSDFSFLLDKEPNFEFLQIAFHQNQGLILHLSKDGEEALTVYEFSRYYDSDIWDIEEFETLVAESAEKAIKEYWTDYIKTEYQKLITGEEK